MILLKSQFCKMSQICDNGLNELYMPRAPVLQYMNLTQAEGATYTTDRAWLIFSHSTQDCNTEYIHFRFSIASSTGFPAFLA